MVAGTIGVVGAGTMGSGVAQALLETGHAVVLVDVTEAQLRSAERRITAGRRTRKLFASPEERGRLDRATGRLETTTDLTRLAQVSFVIENVTESWKIKRALYERLDAVCAADVPFAVNTSAISITRLGGVTNRAACVVGMHFMNPVPLMPVVEVIRAHHTTDATLARACGLARAMGKEAIVVNDSPGFVTNRVMMLAINEAAFLVQEGVSTIPEIDRLFKTCFGHRMGPFETADLIGVDTVLYSLQVLHSSFGDGKYRPCTLLQRMTDAGLHGRKTEHGFYDYRAAGSAGARAEGQHGTRRHPRHDPHLPPRLALDSGAR